MAAKGKDHISEIILVAGLCTAAVAVAAVIGATITKSAKNIGDGLGTGLKDLIPKFPDINMPSITMPSINLPSINLNNLPALPVLGTPEQAERQAAAMYEGYLAQLQDFLNKYGIGDGSHSNRQQGVQPPVIPAETNIDLKPLTIESMRLNPTTPSGIIPSIYIPEQGGMVGIDKMAPSDRITMTDDVQSNRDKYGVAYPFGQPQQPVIPAPDNTRYFWFKEGSLSSTERPGYTKISQAEAENMGLIPRA